jgi:predicted small metal-binding protein
MAASTRKFVDCREFPSEKNCSLMIAGTEEEVLRTARQHAVSEHGHTDGPELEAAIRSSMRDEKPVAAR